MNRNHAAVGLAIVLALTATACVRNQPVTRFETPPATVGAQESRASIPVTPQSGAERPVVTHYAARVPAGDLTAAIAVVGTKVSAYVCDCRSTDAWLSGQVAADRSVQLQTAKAAMSVIINRGGQQAAVTITWRGKKIQVTLPAVGDGFGLFKAKQGTLSGGWIRLPGEAAQNSCGLVEAGDQVVQAGPFTGSGPVDVPGYGALTPHRVNEL
jgi:hypothetical protein